MASITRRLLLQSRQCPSRIRSQVTSSSATQWQRPLSTTAPRLAHDEERAAVQERRVRAPIRTGKMTEHEDSLMSANLAASFAAINPEVIKENPHPLGQDFEIDQDADLREQPQKLKKSEMGFWAEGEPGLGKDDDYFGDDLTTDGHHQLQEHRELREYARLIAWELPLLSQLAQPFEPPKENTPFRFRYTTYMGESHPAINKVVVEFAPLDLKLTQIQTNKLIKLAGPRYNPSTQIMKMSCEQFDTQAQNKRFLGETIFQLIEAAKDSKDTFEDVPFDFRHHKPKNRVQFPKEWVLTPERKKYLEEKRQKVAELEEQRTNNGQIVDGKTLVETSLPFLEAQAPAEPVMVGGPRGRPLR